MFKWIKEVFTGAQNNNIGKVIRIHPNRFLEIADCELYKDAAIYYDKTNDVNKHMAWPWLQSELKPVHNWMNQKNIQALIAKNTDIVFDSSSENHDGLIPETDQKRQEIIGRVANETMQEYVNDQPGPAINKAMSFLGWTLIIMVIAKLIQVALG